MRFRIAATSAVATLITALPSSAYTADVLHRQRLTAVEGLSDANVVQPPKLFGRATVVDGRTLWFPGGGHLVRLASIDACELPQWSYDPRKHRENSIPKPVPCGPLAKAWLRRTIGDAQVTCIGMAHDADGALLGRCTVDGQDLAIAMLRVGWAKVRLPAPRVYLRWQDHAKLARHGMWGTYVLDMPEWRAKAADRTLSRRPIADFNLLAERESEISPPFQDARKRPHRTDR